MTLAQRRVFDVIVAYLRDRGCSPSYADIGAAADLASLSTVYKHVCALELDGLISFRNSISVRKGRSINITQAGAELAGIAPQFTVTELRRQIDLKDKQIADLKRQLEGVYA